MISYSVVCHSQLRHIRFPMDGALVGVASHVAVCSNACVWRARSQDYYELGPFPPREETYA
jgi:hypothetical protein